jgi:nucleoside-triphosphatase THEP1
MKLSETPHSIFLVSGPVQAGKTTFLSSLVTLLEREHISAGGFLCPGTFSSGLRSGFELRQVGTGAGIFLASEEPKEGWFPFRRFWFNPQGFERGRQWIEQGLESRASVVVIDEVGPMELEGGGWSDTLDMLARQATPIQCWSVRKPLVRKVMERWNISSGHVIDIGEETPEKALDRFMLLIKVKQNHGKSHA